MTISSATRIAGPFNGTGSQTSFSFSFKVFVASDVLVTLTDASGNITTQTLTSQYSVVLNANQNTAPGGTVTMVTAPPSGYTLVIGSQVPMLQPADLTNAGNFYPQVINDALDRLTILIQQAHFGNAISVPEITGLPLLPPAAARANLLLSFDSSGNPIVVAPASGSATALATSIANGGSPSQGAGQVGNGIQTYGANTVGGALFTTVWGDGVTDQSANLLAANALGYPIRIKGVLVIGTPTTITVPIVDTMAQIFSTASQVTINNNQAVRPEWFGFTTGCIARAINALPTTGGTVQCEDRVYPMCGHVYGTSGVGSGSYMSKDNVAILGRKTPRFADDCQSLVGGTIIQGMFLAYAHNFFMSDLGIDCGKTVLQTFYSNTEAAGVTEALNITYPDNVTKAASPLKRSVRLHNVTTLASSPGAPVHSFLLEGITDVHLTGECIAMYGTHGFGIKFGGGSIEGVTAYCNDSEGVVFKSDTQASSIVSDVTVGKIATNSKGPAGYSPYAVSTAATNYGTQFYAAANSMDKIKIGQIIAENQNVGLGTLFSGSYDISGVHVGNLTTDQALAAGTPVGSQFLSSAGQRILHFQIDSQDTRNTSTGASFQFAENADTENHVSVGILEVDVAARAVDVSSQSYVSIGQVVAANCSDAVYRITGTPKLTVGMLYKDTATPSVYSTVSGGLAPALSNGWTAVAGNDPFSVDLLGGRVCLRGLIKPGTSNVFMTLPRWAWPATTKRFVAYGNNAGTAVAVQVNIQSDGTCLINEFSGTFANCTTWLTLSGITYDLQA